MGIDYPPPSHLPSPPNLTPSHSHCCQEANISVTYRVFWEKVASRALGAPDPRDVRLVLCLILASETDVVKEPSLTNITYMRKMKRTDRRHKGSLCYKQGALVWQQLAISWNRNSTFSLRSLSKATIMHYNKYEILCVEQLGCAEKKAQNSFFVRPAVHGANIFQIFFIIFFI